MPLVEINDLATIGLVKDTPAHILPPEAWTIALNMRIVDGGWEVMSGWEQVFGTPTVAPHFAMPVRVPGATLWTYFSLTKAYSFDGATHLEITRAAGDYTASETREWGGTLLGGVPIFNNGVDVPQFWTPTAHGTDLQNLTNWPGTLRARRVMAFGPFLIAIGVTAAGTGFPHLVKWSHPADPGSVPISWDENDPTMDTGQVDLSDVQSGILIEMLPLSEVMYLYKESSTWKMRFIGGRAIMDFGKSAWLPTTGILAPRCVCLTRDGMWQVVVTQDDIIKHNGNQVRSLLSERMKRSLFEAIDPVNYVNSFLFDNPNTGEVWFCYPASGSINPNRALLVYYEKGGEVWPLYEADGITFRNAAVGPVEAAAEDGWEDDDLSWEDDEEPWASSTRRKVIVCGTDSTKLLSLDTGTLRDGVAITGTLQRTGLSVLGKKRNNEWIVDWDRQKLADQLWPKCRGVVSIRFGAQDQVDGSITWGTAVSFDATSMSFNYGGPVSGRAHGVEYSGVFGWRLEGYKYDILDLGMF